MRYPMPSFRCARRWAWFRVLLSALLCGALGACRPPPVPTRPLSLSEQLLDLERREAAFCALLSQGRYLGTPRYQEEPDCRINHVLRAPQAEGEPMYIVFRAVDAEVFPESGPGVARGPFTLVDGEGRFVPIFSSANVIGSETRLFSHTGDGRLAVAHHIRYGPSGSPWSVQMLHIVPVTPGQRSILSVVVGPPFIGFMSADKHYAWTWRLREQPSGAPPLVELGPRSADGALARVAATFRFEPGEGRYAGPEGSVTEGFLRVSADSEDCDCGPYSHAEAWVRNFVRAAGSFESPLPVVVEYQPRQNESDPSHPEADWPGPGDAQPVLRIRMHGDCPPETVELEYGSWSQRVEAPAFRTEIPTQVLKQLSAGKSVTLRWSGRCVIEGVSSFQAP
ncbi:hypothetical protein ACN28I_39485 [Archangium gephyra]|uniref:hypothetical protein n=1 Tax=Archangium gephyra TaxID=48 RepID=UPI003B775DC7